MAEILYDAVSVWKKSVGGCTAACCLPGYLGRRHISGSDSRTFAGIGILVAIFGSSPRDTA